MVDTLKFLTQSVIFFSQHLRTRRKEQTPKRSHINFLKCEEATLFINVTTLVRFFWWEILVAPSFYLAHVIQSCLDMMNPPNSQARDNQSAIKFLK